MTIFDSNKKYDIDSTMFLDPKGGVNIARYDIVKYKKLDDLFEKQIGFFWRPQEVDVTRDAKDFKELTPNEQHIFTSNLKRQILLDSVQGRGPAMLLPLVSIPELENWITVWTFSEQIHSKSYTHIIRNVYSNPSEIFDEILNIKEIVDCASDISKYYDDLNDYIIRWQSEEFVHADKRAQKAFIYEMKTALWLCLHSINALEGVRFYVSFACSWNFAEQKKMEGNAKIIKLIARDENLHLASTQQILKWLPTDDPDFEKIKKKTKSKCEKMWINVVNQELEWAEYLFKDGSMIGLNESILQDYIEWIARKRMKAVDLDPPSVYTITSNPLPWTQKWIAGGEVQVAPQESEITSYVVGAIKQDVDDSTFEDISL